MPSAGSATFGFIGSGKVSAKNAKALLSEEIATVNGNARFIIPVSSSHWSDSLDHVVTFAMDNDIPYEVVVDGTEVDLAKKDEAVKEVLAECVKAHKVTKIGAKLVGLLSSAPSPRLVILWDDEDDDAVRTFERADEAGVPAYDFTNGMDQLQFDDDEEEEGDSLGGVQLAEEPAEDEDEFDQEAAVKEVERLVGATDYTEDDLEGLELDELKTIAAGLNIDVPPRTRTATYRTLILKAQSGATVDPETGEIEHVVPEEADESEDGDEAQIPEEEEDEDAVRGLNALSDAELDEVHRFMTDDYDDAPRVALVGSCLGCGGPIFAIGEPPVVTWEHAGRCPIS